MNATQKQIEFIRTLLADRDLTGTSFGYAVESGIAEDVINMLTKQQASNSITTLKGLPRKSSTPAPVAGGVPEGMHRFGESIFKVQRAVHGSGNLYAKRLTRSISCTCENADHSTVKCLACRDPKAGEWSFEYAPGAMKFLSAETALTLDEAKEWGALYGTCCQCGRTLTDEGSIEAGIGPVCAGKF